MRIETSTGKTFDINVICPHLRNKRKILIELDDERPLEEIAQDFDGIESILIPDEAMGEYAYKAYEGFSRLVGIQQDLETGKTRLTLERR